jgi:hypothetical protein|tara:strand:+ start:493 stop:627 length:135 start_codon:yes stop_codon:yes gene_type:complete
MEFLTNLFWFPLNFAYLAFNLALWGIIIWGVIEGVKYLMDKYAN